MFEIRLLDADADGVQQITDLLSDANNKYDAIHIISHGDVGQVNLGNTQLTSDSLSGYADELASWSSALSEDADILFYGCDLASNAEGEQFIQSVSAITGADVAASDDLTGSAEKGGDWELEETVGIVEATSLSAENWDGTLADKDSDGVDDADDLDDDNDGILDVDEGYVPAQTTPLNTSTLNSPGFPTNTELAGRRSNQLATARLRRWIICLAVSWILKLRSSTTVSAETLLGLTAFKFKMMRLWETTFSSSLVTPEPLTTISRNTLSASTHPCKISLSLQVD